MSKPADKEKMISVLDRETGKERVVNLDENGKVSLHTLQVAFHNANGLSYIDENLQKEIIVQFDATNEYLIIPSDGFNRQYFISKRLEEHGREKVLMEYLREKVYFIVGNEANGSGILIDDGKILTASHLGFKLFKKYEVKHVFGKSIQAQCQFIDTEYDFAFLISNELPKVTTPTSCLSSGMKFMILGYPRDMDGTDPGVSCGTIEGFDTNRKYQIGIPGSKRGYSGGPVFDYSGLLCGILIGSTSCMNADTTFRQVCDAYSEQKDCRILPFHTAWAFFQKDEHQLKKGDDCVPVQVYWLVWGIINSTQQEQHIEFNAEFSANDLEQVFGLLRVQKPRDLVFLPPSLLYVTLLHVLCDFPPIFPKEYCVESLVSEGTMWFAYSSLPEGNAKYLKYMIHFLLELLNKHDNFSGNLQQVANIFFQKYDPETAEQRKNFLEYCIQRQTKKVNYTPH